MRPLFSLYFRAALILACIPCDFRSLYAQDSGGFKFLEVKVVDPDGKPMADVPVEISIGEINFPMPTDEKGIVAVNVPTGERAEVAIQVRHKDYVAMGVGWRGDKKIPESVTIPLSKGVTFGGVVHDEQGQPVEGTQVTGEMVIENRHGLVNDGKVMPYLDGELAKTDKEGRWQCSMAPEGDIRLELSFSHPAFVSDLFNNCDGKWDELRSMKQVVVLERGMVLGGNVIDTNGKPVANVIVEAMSNVDRQRRGSQVVSDHEGKFKTYPIPIGKASLSVVAAGFAPYMREIEISQSDESLILRLDEGRPIRIQLVDESDKFIVSAQVTMEDWLYPGSTTFVGERQETDAQGIWEWPHAPEGESKYLFLHPEYMETELKLVAGNQLQKVTLEPRVKVTGNVIDKDTRIPIDKFKVTQLLWIDCGQTEGKDCLVVRDSNVVQDSGDYTFESGARCKQFKMLCEAEGYKSASSRIMHTDEKTITFDFELEPKEIDN